VHHVTEGPHLQPARVGDQQFDAQPATSAEASALLADTIERAHRHSPFFRAHLDANHVRPNDVRSIDDLPLLPFTSKQHLRQSDTFGWLAVPDKDVVRVHSSSGTTGRRTVCAYTRVDVDDWADMFARCYAYAGVVPLDRVQIMVGYGLWTAGAGFQAGAERLGAMAVPVGPGNLDLQLEVMRDLQTTVIGATSSFALLLAETVAESHSREGLALTRGLIGSERWGEATRRRVHDLLGISTFDIYGLTELWGPGTGIECDRHDGIHVWTDHYLVEVIDPHTLQPVPEGEVGELVLTTLTKQATPLLRYRTGDLTSFDGSPCPCGSPFPRIGRIVGRTDDMIKVRGVAMYPAQVDEVLAAFPGAGPEYQIHVHRERGRDDVAVYVETACPLAEELAAGLQRRIGIRVDVREVPPMTLPRTDRKTQRVFDHRTQ